MLSNIFPAVMPSTFYNNSFMPFVPLFSNDDPLALLKATDFLSSDIGPALLLISRIAPIPPDLSGDLEDSSPLDGFLGGI